MEENKFNTRQIKRSIDKEVREDKLIEKMNTQFLCKGSDANSNFDDVEKNVEIFVKQCEDEVNRKERVLENLRNLATEEGNEKFRRLSDYKSQRIETPKKYINIGQENMDNNPVRMESIESIVCQLPEKIEPSPEKKEEIREIIRSFGTEDGRKIYDKYVNYQTGDCYNEDDNTASKNVSVKAKEPKNCMYEYVNHPSHYNNYSVEVIDMMLRIYGPQKTYDFCELNAFKYRMRMGTKPGSDIKQDLEKENWYIKKAKEIKELYHIDDHNFFEVK